MSHRGAKNAAFFKGNDDGSAKMDLSQHLKKLLRNGRATGVLNLSSQNMDEISEMILNVNEALDPDEKFWEINPLTKLDVSFNNITTIPPNITKLLDLVLFKGRNNKFRHIADEMYSLKLKHLDLSNNNLETISPQIGYLSELKEAIDNLKNKLLVYYWFIYI